MSEPVTIMPFRLIVPGEAKPGAPTRDFRPNIQPADAPEEAPDTKSGGEDEDPKGDTVTASADSSKSTGASRKGASPSPEEKSASAVQVVSAPKPLVPSPPTS